MERSQKHIQIDLTPDEMDRQRREFDASWRAFTGKELEEMPSLDDEIVKRVTKGTILEIDDAFINALQQIIPEATKYNIHQYAHRIVVKSKPGNAYPITAYCDGQEFFRLDEPQTDFVMNDNTATMTIKQNYWAIRLEES